MRHGTLSSRVLLVAALTGCPGGGGSIGDPCNEHGDCNDTLQCARNTCVPRCQRGPECGDGYACDVHGYCRISSGQLGDACTSEIDCSPGLACQIDGDQTGESGRLRASCAEQRAGRPAGSACARDNDCRNGTCAIGHCVDLCRETRDCGAGSTCMQVPRVEAEGAMFGGCLASEGNITWSIAVDEPTDEILLPVPSAARHASLVLTVDDQAQRVGALSVFSPAGINEYRPCSALGSFECGAAESEAQYYANAIRHRPGLGQSVLALPTTPSAPLQTGAYRVRVSSIRPNGTAGSAIPNVTAVVRLGAGTFLDLRFHFLDLEAHPCAEAFGGEKLDAATARTETFFQSDFLGELRSIFAPAGIAPGTVTYDDVVDHPDLDGLDVGDVGSLLSLGRGGSGLDVFFVRTLSPVGLQAIGPSPGPAGFGGTIQSGIVIGADTLCYRTWRELARLTAHEIARYMGLYHNVEVDSMWRDSIVDSDDSPNNLMFFSELGGTELSPGQRDVLIRSPVLR